MMHATHLLFSTVFILELGFMSELVVYRINLNLVDYFDFNDNLALQKTWFVHTSDLCSSRIAVWMLKESRYVKLASTIYRVLRNSRIPLFLHKKSNHIFTVWQNIVLVTIRQYEGKSYRMFVEWLIEAHYLRLFLQLSRIPHFSTLQKFADRINNTLLGKIISSFIYCYLQTLDKYLLEQIRVWV